MISLEFAVLITLSSIMMTLFFYLNCRKTKSRFLTAEQQLTEVTIQNKQLRDNLNSLNTDLQMNRGNIQQLSDLLISKDEKLSEMHTMLKAAEDSVKSHSLFTITQQKRLATAKADIQTLLGRLSDKDQKILSLQNSLERFNKNGQNNETKRDSLDKVPHKKERCFSCNGQGHHVKGTCSICGGTGIRPEVSAKQQAQKWETATPIASASTSYPIYDFDNDWDLVSTAECYSEANTMLDDNPFDYSAEMGHDGDDY